MKAYNREAVIADLRDRMLGTQNRGVKKLCKLPADEAESELTAIVAQLSDRERAGVILRLDAERCRFAVPFLIDQLRSHPVDIVRAISAFSLRCIGDDSAIPALIEALADSSDKVILSACMALYFLGAHSSIPKLMELLEHPLWKIRLDAVVVLLNFGVMDLKVFTTLEALVAQPEAKAHDQDVEDMRLIEEQYGGKLEPTPEIWLDKRMDELLPAARKLMP